MVIVDNKIEIKKLGSAMTSTISQLAYNYPNFRAIRQYVWEKKTVTDAHTETQTHTHTHTHTDSLEFFKDR